MTNKPTGPKLRIPENYHRLIKGVSVKWQQHLIDQFTCAYTRARRTIIVGTRITIARSEILQCQKSIAWMQLGDQVVGNLYEWLGDQLKDPNGENPYVCGLRFNDTLEDDVRRCRVHADERFRHEIGIRITPKTAGIPCGYKGESLMSRVCPVGK